MCSTLIQRRIGRPVVRGRGVDTAHFHPARGVRLRVHHLSDVVAGVVLGVAGGIAGAALFLF